MISNLINRRPPLGEMQTVSTFLNSARQVSRVFRVVAPRAAPETRPLHFSFCTTRLSERCAVVLTFGSKKVARGLWRVKHLKILISSTASHCNILYCIALYYIVLYCIALYPPVGSRDQTTNDPVQPRTLLRLPPIFDTFPLIFT